MRRLLSLFSVSLVGTATVLFGGGSSATKMRRSAPAFMPGVKRRRRYVGRVWDSMYWRRTESGAPPAD
ncbi:MAG: hypothetical protein ACYDGN_18095, partial [Acidimicrobiales bacterium]